MTHAHHMSKTAASKTVNIFTSVFFHLFQKHSQCYLKTLLMMKSPATTYTLQNIANIRKNKTINSNYKYQFAVKNA
ncbi:hypothetical protein L596_012749 [Steinernema carpocapsae]|uniref:Uncharacterized protein n=1 Tax=Steinernema carpocapsae TaxID=34508 RepID=A0A4U5NYU3_STECR|nr:hypothetical protein L596_012749 [Steinernema carpocapsae]